MNHEFQSPSPTEPEDSDFTAEAAGEESDSLRQDLARQKDLNLRLAADFENFKRRSRQESEARAAAQKESFIQELLPTLDNLERALAAGASPDSQQFHQGVEMTSQQLLQLLQRHGIAVQECIGQTFDPHQHDAVSVRHEPAQPDQAILEVFQRGYRRGEKVFRPARVVVNDLTHPKHTRHAR